MPERRPTKGINPRIFAGALWGGILFEVVLVIVSEIVWPGPDGSAPDVVGPAALISLLALGFAQVYWLICLHRCWSALWASTARTTPRRAVGFLFIPFFNIYWQFVAIKGLAEDANKFLANRRIRHHGIDTGLSNWLCILNIVSIVPCVGFVAEIMYLVLQTKLIYQWADFVNCVSVTEI